MSASMVGPAEQELSRQLKSLLGLTNNTLRQRDCNSTTSKVQASIAPFLRQ